MSVDVVRQGAIGKRAPRAIYVSHKTRHIARLAQDDKGSWNPTRR